MRPHPGTRETPANRITLPRCTCLTAQTAPAYRRLRPEAHPPSTRRNDSCTSRRHPPAAGLERRRLRRARPALPRRLPRAASPGGALHARPVARPHAAGHRAGERGLPPPRGRRAGGLEEPGALLRRGGEGDALDPGGPRPRRGKPRSAAAAPSRSPSPPRTRRRRQIVEVLELDEALRGLAELDAAQGDAGGAALVRRV